MEASPAYTLELLLAACGGCSCCFTGNPQRDADRIVRVKTDQHQVLLLGVPAIVARSAGSEFLLA